MKGKSEVLAYPTVTWLDGTVTTARKAGEGFALQLASGEEHHGKRIVLALGVADELPAIPGLVERWGKSVFHCPYCHGYELGKGRIACLASSPMSIHHALMLPDWGDVTFFTNGMFEPDAEQQAALAKRSVRVKRAAVESIAGEGTSVSVHLASGAVESFAGLFVAPKTRPASPLASQLGCELEDGPMGPFIKTDAMKETTVPGVFSCGDVALAAGSVAFAVGDGMRVGVAAHQSLARQLASRARRRVQGNAPVAEPDRERRQTIIAAFLSAARESKFEALLEVLAPDIVVRADDAAVRLGGQPELRDAEAAAKLFLGRAGAARPAIIDGNMGAAVIIHGKTRFVLEMTFANDRIATIHVHHDPEAIAALDVVLG